MAGAFLFGLNVCAVEFTRSTDCVDDRALDCSSLNGFGRDFASLPVFCWFDVV